jgi:Ca-activated chloride channel family protein
MKKLLTILGLIIACSQLSAQQSADAGLAKGNDAYRKQEFDKAQDFYRKVLEKSPSNTTASYNLGNALYRDKKTEEAEKIFDLTAENASDKNIKADAHYNKGVTLTMQKKIAESIQEYKEALRLNPSDSLARENLQRALQEQKNQQQNNKKNDQKKENKQQQKLNKQQIMQLLNALQEQEKLLQQKLQKSKVPAPGQPEKDW